MDRKKEKKDVSGGVPGLMANMQGNQSLEQSQIQGWPHRELMAEKPFASKRQLKLLGMVGGTVSLQALSTQLKDDLFLGLPMSTRHCEHRSSVPSDWLSFDLAF